MGSLSRNKQDTIQKSEGKVSKPSLNELKLKSQAEQMKKSTTSGGREKPVVSSDSTSHSSSSTSQNQQSQKRKPNNPIMSQMNEQLFHQSISNLNLSVLLYKHEMKERRLRPKTFTSDTNTASQQQSGGAPSAYIHHNAVSGSGEQFPLYSYSSGPSPSHIPPSHTPSSSMTEHELHASGVVAGDTLRCSDLSGIPSIPTAFDSATRTINLTVVEGISTNAQNQVSEAATHSSSQPVSISSLGQP